MNLEPLYAENVEFLPESQQNSHHVINCTIEFDGVKYPAVAKKNKHNEAIKFQELTQTIIGRTLPEYYGIYTKDDTEYFIMEDLNANYTSPCVTDLKLGTRAWDLKFKQDVKDELKEIAKKSTSWIYGVRFISSVTRKNQKVESGIYVSEGINFTFPEFAEKFIEVIPKQHLEYTFTKLIHIRRLFDQMYRDIPGFRMYAGSLIITYDGDKPEQKPRINIIDVAHTHLDIDDDGGDTENPRFDDNVLRGLDTLICILGLHQK